MGKNHMYSATVSTRLITAGRCKSEKPNGSQRAASTLMTRGVDTDTLTPKTVAICVRLVTRAPAARAPAARHAA
jgi:hypothetical protein